ncbi:MAG: hypothetical protein RIA62_06875 [Cyclobacteriaceae bacterium]
MRNSLIVFGALILFVVIHQALKFHGNDPEELLIGNWQEVSRSYERIDDPKKTLFAWIGASDDEKHHEVTREIAHDGDIWHIEQQGQLSLNNKDYGHKNVIWKLKGRGNILELVYNNTTSEVYSIQEITDDKMVLYFNTDLQVRGIVKMVFEKKNTWDYAQKHQQ